MSNSTKTPERVSLAKQLLSEGMRAVAVAKVLGISPKSVIYWTDEGYYQKDLRRSREWQKNNKPRVRELQNGYYRKRTREQKDRINSVVRALYARNPRHKNRNRLFQARLRLTPQGRLKSKLGIATRRYLLQYPQFSGWFMRPVTGMSRTEYTERFSGGGDVFDHVVPLSAFDLTNHEHLVRAQHPSNIQKLTPKENGMKSNKVPPNLDIMSLPWIGTEEALEAARKFIKRQLDALDKLKAKQALTPASSATPDHRSNL